MRSNLGPLGRSRDGFPVDRRRGAVVAVALILSNVRSSVACCGVGCQPRSPGTLSEYTKRIESHPLWQQASPTGFGRLKTYYKLQWAA